MRHNEVRRNICMGRLRLVRRTFVSSSAVASILIGALVSAPSYADFVAKDPGVRGGAAGAGGFVALTGGDLQLANDSREAFEETEGLGDGLGPRFNAEGCAQSHAFPASGGTRSEEHTSELQPP